MSSRYKVRRHDTLSEIAAKQLGSAARWPEIAHANGLKPPYLIAVGLPLRIPGSHAQMHTKRILPHRHVRLDNDPPDAKAIGTVTGFGAGDRAAKDVMNPTLGYKFDKVEFPLLLTVGGYAKLIVDGEIKVQRKGPLELEFSKDKIGITLAGASVNGLTSETAFDSADEMSTKIRSEYSAFGMKLFSEVKCSADLKTRKAELNFSIGWKASSSGYRFDFPATHVFTFEPLNDLKSDVLSGSLTFTVEVVVMPPNSTLPPPRPVRVPDAAFDAPMLLPTDLRPTPDQALAFAACVAILIGLALAPEFTLPALPALLAR